ncbi:uncharacterized protein LOC127258930 [Andrographis paniculata]|uniref:uncharacterized protein LOC127258930 n=1 Tax=Andrographis paniculata TaxID=175694 RepID=UPI0021E7665A|nr:uncharacterized protein LOC127258930 [Andrographis paniculata]
MDKKDLKEKDFPPPPEGWTLECGKNRNGQSVKCYSNVCGQKFYSRKDLDRYIIFAKERGFSIYDPNFDASSIKSTRGRKKKSPESTETSNKSPASTETSNKKSKKPKKGPKTNNGKASTLKPKAVEQAHENMDVDVAS